MFESMMFRFAIRDRSLWELKQKVLRNSQKPKKKEKSFASQ
jgi:hypothetical protein